MAVNRYDQPAQADFINTYVPIPFDQMFKVGMLKQSMIEANDKIVDDTLMGLSKITAAPADQPYLNEKINKVKSEIADIYNNSIPGSYEGKRRIMNLRNSIVSDPVLKDVMYNATVYFDAMEQRQRAANEKAPVENMMELNDLISSLGPGGPGTLGRIKQTGSSGAYNKGTWTPFVDVQDEMEKRINDVEESIRSTVGFDVVDGNKYIIEGTRGGRTLQALGAPLGIVFTKNKKGDFVIDTEKSNTTGYFGTPAGEQLARTAAFNVKRGLADNFGDEYKRLYFEKAASVINERVSDKSTTKLSEDQFSLAKYRHDLEDEKFLWSSPMALFVDGDKLSSINKINDATKVVDKKIEDSKDALDNFLNNSDIKEVVSTDKNNVTTVRYVDKNGLDVSEKHTLLKALYEQSVQEKESLNNRIRLAKEAARVPATWEPDVSVLNKAEEQGKIAESRYIADSLEKTGTMPDIESQKKIGEEAKLKYIEKADPMLAAINNKLKEFASKNSTEGTTTKFTSKSLNEQALREFPQLMLNEVKEAGNGNSLKSRDKQKLISTYTNNPERILFQGSAIHPQLQKVQFIYQVLDDKKRLSKTIMVDAPEGAEQELIKAGAFNKGDLMIHQRLTLLDNDPYREITLGKDDHLIKVTKNPDTGVYQAIINWKNENTDSTYPKQHFFADRTELITYINTYFSKSVK